MKYAFPGQQQLQKLLLYQYLFDWDEAIAKNTPQEIRQQPVLHFSPISGRGHHLLRPPALLPTDWWCRTSHSLHAIHYSHVMLATLATMFCCWHFNLSFLLFLPFLWSWLTRSSPNFATGSTLTQIYKLQSKFWGSLLRKIWWPKNIKISINLQLDCKYLQNEMRQCQKEMACKLQSHSRQCILKFGKLWSTNGKEQKKSFDPCILVRSDTTDIKSLSASVCDTTVATYAYCQSCTLISCPGRLNIHWIANRLLFIANVWTYSSTDIANKKPAVL